jgi:uncharacterized protein
MGTFSAYSLPIQGLKIGIHEFKYALDATFFNQFEDNAVGPGLIEALVELDKRSDMLVFRFELGGWLSANCDRCTADIRMPLEGEQMLYVKYSDTPTDDDDEVVFVARDASIFNVAKYLYEFTVLALPISNTYDCEHDEVPPCNFEVLQMLEKNAQDQQNSEGDNSIWDALKDLK